MYCTAQGIQQIFYNNYKWGVTFKNCESLCCTLVTYIILYNILSIKDLLFLDYQFCFFFFFDLQFSLDSNFKLTILFLRLQLQFTHFHCCVMYDCVNILRFIQSSVDETMQLFLVFTTALLCATITRSATMNILAHVQASSRKHTQNWNCCSVTYKNVQSTYKNVQSYRTMPAIFQSVGIQVYSPIINVPDFLSVHNASYHCVIKCLMLANRVGIMWYLVVVIIYFSLPAQALACSVT